MLPPKSRHTSTIALYCVKVYIDGLGIWLIIRRDGSGDLLIARDTAGAMWEGVGSETSSDSNLQYHGGFLRFFQPLFTP